MSTVLPMKLLPITADGSIEGLDEDAAEQMPAMIAQVSAQMVDFYAAAGYQEPWVGYIAQYDGMLVGGGAFKAPPEHGRVEIAYYTVTEEENQGYATATAQALIDLAIQTDEELSIVAQTLPETNASNHLLQKLGFQFHDVVDHPEDGPVWEWRLF